MQVDGKVEEEQVNMEVRGEVRRSRQNVQIYIYIYIYIIIFVKNIYNFLF